MYPLRDKPGASSNGKIGIMVVQYGLILRPTFLTISRSPITHLLTIDKGLPKLSTLPIYPPTVIQSRALGPSIPLSSNHQLEGGGRGGVR
jgi:hypothetical protein